MARARNLFDGAARNDRSVPAIGEQGSFKERARRDEGADDQCQKAD
jgi:hypothetical protein